MTGEYCPVYWDAPGIVRLGDPEIVRHHCDLPVGHQTLVADSLPPKLIDKLGLKAHHCHCGARGGEPVGVK